MLLREALKKAEDLGVQIVDIRRTGELRVQYPGKKPVVFNCRRKDASKKLVCFLSQVERLTNGE